MVQLSTFPQIYRHWWHWAEWHAWVAGMTESKQAKQLREVRDAMLRRCVEAQSKLRFPPVFCRMTALGLLEVELPRLMRCSGSDGDMRPERVVAGQNAHHALAGIHDVQWSGLIQTQVVADAVCCTTAECTWVMMAPVLSMLELVVLGDSMMRRDAALKRTSIAGFEQYLDQLRERCKRTKVKGFRACCKALKLIRENTDSSMESRVRVTLDQYGLGVPNVNHPVVHPITGRMLYLDMAYPELKIAVEYDGRFHADQWEADVERRRILDELGWDVIQVTAADMRTEGDRHALAMRVAQHIGIRLGRKVRVRAPLAVEQLADGRRAPEAAWKRWL